MATVLYVWSDGSATVIVERLTAGEVGIRTEGGGVILTDEAAAELGAALEIAALRED